MKEVTVSESDHGRQIDVTAGNKVILKLPENPSTGYQWELAAAEDTVLKLENDTYQPPTTSVPGVGGIRILTFYTTSAGFALIRLCLRRSWESEPAPMIFEVTVRVQPNRDCSTLS